MLVAMTFNVGLFVCVIAGLALGTLMFGHILAAEPNVGYDGVLPWLSRTALFCCAAQHSQYLGWCNRMCCVACLYKKERHACSCANVLAKVANGSISHGWIAFQPACIQVSIWLRHSL